MENFVTRDDLQRCSLLELREKLRQRGVKEVGLERSEAVERVLAANGGTTSRLEHFLHLVLISVVCMWNHALLSEHDD